MNGLRHRGPRAGGARARRLALVVGLAAAGVAGSARGADAQQVLGGDFDICDDRGTLRGNTANLSGRAGFGTTRGEFILSNAATVDQDCDLDGFTPGVDFLRLYIAGGEDFQNVSDPSLVIPLARLALQDVPRPLRNGFQNSVGFVVNIPNGTRAGRYRGRVVIQDSLITRGLNPNGEALRVDYFFVEIEVLPGPAVEIVEGDDDERADSVFVRGRAGQTVNVPIRIANIGNVDLTGTRIEATDLVSREGTGLRIRRNQISFSPTALSQVGFGDTARVVVTVRIPVGLLAGDYVGELILQSEQLGERRIPLIVRVQTVGEIVFETNPVIGRQGDQAVIIFNGDPGSTYRLRIFDMMGLTVFGAEGRVFGGDATVGQSPDRAVRFTWNLTNGRAEQVAGGMYYVIVDVQQDGERRQLRDKLMVIR